jgi:predicted glycosyltransferase involved in capsule biosynthesis
MPNVQSLSILVPTYNDLCVTLVDALRLQAESSGISYEILVGDDGSTDTNVIQTNQAINDWPHCRYILRTQNSGRASIRNFLAQQARYPYLLFIDSDMTIASTDFITRYLSVADADVIIGGVSIDGSPEALKGNLRYLYEKAEEPSHTVEHRQQMPYQHLHTANLLIRRELMLAHPFDERFRHYGYEDVLLGKTLRQHRVPITHIHNPVSFSTFESNAQFVAKTEEGLRTLHQFQSDLRGYSRLLTLVSGIHISLILSLIRLWHRLFQKAERRNLCSSHPSLLVFKLYRLGYFLSLT